MQWTPDTCTCTFEYEPVAELVMADVAFPPTVTTPCPDHEMLGADGDKIHRQVLKENRSKNNVRELAAHAAPKMAKPVNGGVDLADDVDYKWSFTGSGLARSLVVEFTGRALSNAEKTQIRAAIAANVDRVPVATTVL